MFCQVAAILSHSESLASIPINKMVGRGCLIIDCTPGYISYAYWRANLSKQATFGWNLVKFYSFAMTKTCNLIKILTKYKWTVLTSRARERL